MKYVWLSALLITIAVVNLFAERTVVNGKIENWMYESVELSKDDPYDFSEKREIYDSSGLQTEKFKFVFDLDHSDKLQLRSGPHYLQPELYISPGDSLYISIKMLDSSMAVEYSGKGQSVNANNLLREFYDTFPFDHHFQSIFSEKMQNPDFSVLEDFITERYKRQVKFYNDKIKNADVPEIFITNMKTNFTYDRAYALMSKMVFDMNRHYKQTPNQVLDLAPHLVTITENAAVGNDDGIYSANYQAFLDSYLTYLFSDWYYMRNIDESPTKMESYRQLFNIIKSNFKGYDYDILMAKSLAEFVRNAETKEDNDYAKEVFKEYYANAKDKKFAEAVREIVEADRFMAGSSAPAFTLRNEKGEKVSLSDFKGKIVYIDFWGTWCRPCLQELPHYAKLQEEYKDNKDIVFVSIALEQRDDYDKWAKFVKEKAAHGVQLYTSPKENSQVPQDYNIQAVPTFILIDREGNLLNTNAPRPSDEKLPELLKEYLEKSKY